MSSSFYHNKNIDVNKQEEEVINDRTILSIRSIEINRYKNELLVGDMNGTLYIYDMNDYKLYKKISVCDTGIEDMSISPRGSVLGIVTRSGESFICDSTRNYQKILVLEQPYDDYTMKNSSTYRRMRLIQDELERSNIFDHISSSNNAGLSYNRYYVKTESAMKSVTVHNNNTIRLHQIYRDDLTVSSYVKIEYHIDGVCTSYDIHPSNDYIIVISNIGYMYVFKLINGDMRMKVSIPTRCNSRYVLYRHHDRSVRSV